MPHDIDTTDILEPTALEAANTAERLSRVLGELFQFPVILSEDRKMLAETGNELAEVQFGMLIHPDLMDRVGCATTISRALVWVMGVYTATGGTNTMLVHHLLSSLEALGYTHATIEMAESLVKHAA